MGYSARWVKVLVRERKGTRASASSSKSRTLRFLMPQAMEAFLFSRARLPMRLSPRQIFSHTTSSAHRGFASCRKVKPSMWVYRGILSITPLARRKRSVTFLLSPAKAPAMFLRWEGSFSRLS